MGFPDWATFLAALQLQRDCVARHFRDIVFRGTNGGGDGDDAGPAGVEPRSPDADLARLWLEEAAPEVQLRRLAAARDPFDDTADYIRLCHYPKHAVPLGVALPFIQTFLAEL